MTFRHVPARRPRGWVGCRFQWASGFAGDGRDCRVMLSGPEGLLRWVYEDATRGEDGGWIAVETIEDHVAAGRVVVTWIPPAAAAGEGTAAEPAS